MLKIKDGVDLQLLVDNYDFIGDSNGVFRQEERNQYIINVNKDKRLDVVFYQRNDSDDESLNELSILFDLINDGLVEKRTWWNEPPK